MIELYNSTVLIVYFEVSWNVRDGIHEELYDYDTVLVGFKSYAVGVGTTTATVHTAINSVMDSDGSHLEYPHTYCVIAKYLTQQ